MLCFSVTSLLLLELTIEKKDILRPCLESIRPNVQSDPVTLQMAVVEYFEAGLINKKRAFTIANFVKTRFEYLKNQLAPAILLDLKNSGKPGVVIFLDDSNIWKGAKTVASGPHLQFDPRVRIDVGKLITSLRKDRVIVKCTIYGSEPPPYDSFWRIYEDLGAEVITFPRSPITEEKVYSQICADITDFTANHHVIPFKFIFAIGTGDRDMLPGVRIGLKNSPYFEFEYWTWKNSLSRKLIDLSQHEPRLSLHYLDTIKKEITFKELCRMYKPSMGIAFKFSLKAYQTVEQLSTIIDKHAQLPAQFSLARNTTSLNAGDDVIIFFTSVGRFDCNRFKEEVKRANSDIIAEVVDVTTGVVHATADFSHTPTVEEW